MVVRLVVVVFGALGALSAPPVTANAPCDTLQPAAGAVGYRDRGNRCEGLYVLDAASAVRLKAIISGSPPDEAESMVSLSPLGRPPAGKYAIRVTSIDPLEHYQLDAEVDWPSSFAWSAAEVLRPAKISVDRLAPLSWLTAGAERLYVPVRFVARAPVAAPQAPAAIEVLIESTVPFEAIRVTLKRSGAREPIVLEPAGARSPSTYAFTIPKGSASGKVTVWITWRLRGTSQPDTEHWRVWLP